MFFIRSFAGFSLVLAIGYAAGVLMCVDAYHLGQSSNVASGPTGAGVTRLHHWQEPASPAPPGLAIDGSTGTPSIASEICIVVHPESVP